MNISCFDDSAIEADTDLEVGSCSATTNLSWSATGAAYFIVYKNGQVVASTTGSSFTDELSLLATTQNIQYAIKAVADTDDDSASTTVTKTVIIPAEETCSVVPGDISVSCVASSTVNINQATTLRLNLIGTSTAGVSVNWSGRDFPAGGTNAGLTFQKIFTTIGERTVQATARKNGVSVGSCNTVIKVVSPGGGGGEI